MYSDLNSKDGELIELFQKLKSKNVKSSPKNIKTNRKSNLI